MMMKDEWKMMKDEWKMMKYEGLMMKDDDFKLLRGFADKQTGWQTDGQTLVIVELLLWLKIYLLVELTIMQNDSSQPWKQRISFYVSAKFSSSDCTQSGCQVKHGYEISTHVTQSINSKSGIQNNKINSVIVQIHMDISIQKQKYYRNKTRWKVLKVAKKVSKSRKDE